MSGAHDLQRAIDDVIRLQSWCSSWKQKDDELLLHLHRVRACLEQRLVLVLAQGA